MADSASDPPPGAKVERLLDAKRATPSRRALARLLGGEEKPPRRS